MIKELKYEVSVGSHILGAAKEAISLAKKEAGRVSVSFNFNGVSLKVNKSSTPEKVLAAFHAEQDKQAEAYRNSPEYKQAQLERANETQAQQLRLDKLIREFGKAIDGGLKALIPWIKAYSEDADSVAVDSKRSFVLKGLLDAGYKTNEFTGENFIAGNKEVMGRYIVGQVLNCMEGGMPPHPNVTPHFCDEYINMPDKPASNNSKNKKFEP